MEKPLVVSLSGISGSGKTTLAHALKSEAPNSEVISFDDISGDWLGRDYCEWSEAGADCNVWNASGFIEQIRNYLEFPLRYIIVDYPFGHAHNEVSPFIDFAVWIDIPLDISLARRILRDFTRRPPKRRDLVGNIADEISAYLDFYMDRHRDTYFRHIETIQSFSNLVVDGTKNPQTLVLEIFNALSLNLDSR